MHDQWYDHAEQPTADIGQPMSPPPAEPGGSRKGRTVTLLVLATVIVLAGAVAVVGYVLNRAEPVAFAVGDCVADAASPIEYDCTDSRAVYRIAARESVVFPLESACMKHPKATKAVADPGAGAKPEVVLCLTPTRFNTTDPGALEAGDCIEVKGAGETVKRVTCGPNNLSKVLSVELHRQIPVTDQACRDQPQARSAFAQSSLGGRAVVLCVVGTDPNDLDNAEVGGCTGKDMRKLVPCNGSAATLRVLTVRVVHQRPAKPECLGVTGARASSMTQNDKTDLVLVLCLGPADDNDSEYAQVGDCIAVSGTDKSARTRRVGCTDPAAKHRVTDRHQPDDGVCAPGSAKITIRPGVDNGTTLCLGPK
ncbi:hypothetical protein [Nocardia sp. NPDC052566]|uniref:LppU/SCO3897 family protein n=1 Tax=Nocardia sp. NPDC052566 TaxID=3364330 RepID=UPI0037CCBD3F